MGTPFRGSVKGRVGNTPTGNISTRTRAGTPAVNTRTPAVNTPTSRFSNRTPAKRSQTDYSQSPASKTPRSSTTSTPIGQPKVISLQEVKRITSSPFSNKLSFMAKVIKLEPRRAHWDKRVQYHRQKVLFADTTTFMIAYMHSEVDEDEDDPKLVEGFTSIITNFRVVKKGDILLHERTKAAM